MCSPQPIGTNKAPLPICPSGPNIQFARNIIRDGTRVQLVGGLTLGLAAAAEVGGGGPEDPVGDAIAAKLGQMGTAGVAAGTTGQLGGAMVLWQNGMPRDAINTAIESAIDSPIPDRWGPVVDQFTDPIINTLEDRVGVVQNACIVAR